MKHLKLLLITLFALSAPIYADDLITTLIVTTKDMQTHQFALTDRPQVRFNGDQLVVLSDRTDASYPLANVLRFHYEKVSYVGIYDHEDQSPDLSYDGNVLIISNIKAGDVASVYGSDGRLVRQLTAQRNGTYRLPLSNLPSGVYLVRTGNTTFKITKR